MAKVTQPLFTDFYEAFGSILVYQRMRDGSVMARKKVRHPNELCSSHVPANSHKWATAVRWYVHNNPQNRSLSECVAHYAMHPDIPKNPYVSLIEEHPTIPDTWQVTLTWDTVTCKWNDWPLDNLAGYHVNFSADDQSWIRLTAGCVPINSFTDCRGSGTWLYTVQAVDDESNISPQSELLIVDLPPSEQSYSVSCYGTGFYV